MEPAILEATATVDVSVGAARAWFLSLKEHPERYQFDTHAGFEFTEGDFGKEGARFQTHERFHGLRTTLRFELREVGDARFTFQLQNLPVWGAFCLEESGAETTQLRLEVGGSTALGTTLLKLPLVSSGVQGQIQREVNHIKASMEAVNTTGG